MHAVRCYAGFPVRNTGEHEAPGVGEWSLTRIRHSDPSRPATLTAGHRQLRTGGRISYVTVRQIPSASSSGCTNATTSWPAIS